MDISSKRVVITGIGLISPYGIGYEVFWDSLLAGKSCVKRIEKFDITNHPSQIAAEFTDFKADDYLDRKQARKMDRFTQFAVIAARKAVEDANLDLDNIDKTRFGVSVGSAAGGMETIETQHIRLIERGPAKCSPFTVPMMIVDMAAGQISIDLGAMGPNKASVSACATSAHCLGDAMHLIKLGYADVMLAGGAEAVITPLAMAGFGVARALSFRNDEPQKASRPWDKDRDGFVMGEGSAIFVLESLEHALARGARIYAEFPGYGASADANEMVAPCEDGAGAVLAMKSALNFAGMKPEQIDYLNAHGTSTPLGDKAEVRAVKSLFGEHAKKVLISSTKSMTGHMLGAAGGIETAVCCLALRDKIVPPTINLDSPDDECDLDFVPHKARKVDKLDATMNNSFGFGGHNASLIFTRYQD
ncbi:MAG: beta-ketoacyl-ACP synthase II [Vampirovibrionia bacterium]